MRSRLLLIGVGPVLGYQLAAGKLGSDWKSIIGAIIGMIFLPIFFLTWPLFVWLFNRSAYSAGRLFLGSIIGIILGIIVFFIIGLTIGQDPSWVGFGGSMLMAFWGGSSAAFMVGREA